MSKRLKLISGEEPLVLDSDDGQETLAQVRDIFRYIDSNFEHWRCDVAALPTKETAMQVYEMVRNSTFQELFNSFGVALDSLTLTQAQIKQFVKHYGDWLKKGGNGTFFLFKIGVEFFVAAAYFFSDGRLGVRVRRFSLDRIFLAKKRHRLVVPAVYAQILISRHISAKKQFERSSELRRDASCVPVETDLPQPSKRPIRNQCKSFRCGPSA